MRSIALVDHTKKYPPGPGVLEAMAKALTVQIERDFAPVWGVAPVPVSVGGRGEKIHFFDTARDAGEVGYHAVDPNGRPYAHVYARSAFGHGSDWLTGPDAIAGTASHEALEMLCDPAANEFSFDGFRTLWAREVSDPVQADAYRIEVGRKLVPVSNFVLPAFFNPWSEGPVDHLRRLKKPFTLAKGGYSVCSRAGADFEKEGRRFDVRFDKRMPDWLQAQKKRGFGRTYWRLLLHN